MTKEDIFDFDSEQTAHWVQSFSNKKLVSAYFISLMSRTQAKARTVHVFEEKEHILFLLFFQQGNYNFPYSLFQMGNAAPSLLQLI